MENDTFVDNTRVISYSSKNFSLDTVDGPEAIFFSKDKTIQWINTYGMHFNEEVKQVVLNNQIDEFVLKLLYNKENTNKVIVLDDLLFITIRVLKTDEPELDSEQMVFMASPRFVWSIQEKKDDHFDWIRDRLGQNKGIVRRKKADYLLFLILESIVENYHKAFDKYTYLTASELDASKVKPTPEFTVKIERTKQQLFMLKKATSSLDDAVGKLQRVNMNGFNNDYFNELHEQVSALISEVDFELEELESSINLIFSIQGHRLNEVMKTLTIFSVIFIPLTFLAGIYGMNFKHIPELETQYGYFILLGIMALVALLIVWYFKRKNWF